MTAIDLEGVGLLARAIEKSGLSSTRFAEEVLSRDPRTVRRWLSGESPVAKAVKPFLTRYLEEKKP